MTDFKIKDLRIPNISVLDFGNPWGFFDGAYQGHPTTCGVGVVLFINYNHYIHVRYAPRRGTNNRAEFIAFLTLLEITSSKDLKKLQIMGDSKLVIDWANQKATVSDVSLEPLLRDIKLPMQSFEWLSFSHIFRELDEKANSLSKEALSLPVGELGFYEFLDNVEAESMEFQL